MPNELLPYRVRRRRHRQVGGLLPGHHGAGAPETGESDPSKPSPVAFPGAHLKSAFLSLGNGHHLELIQYLNPESIDGGGFRPNDTGGHSRSLLHQGRGRLRRRDVEAGPAIPWDSQPPDAERQGGAQDHLLSGPRRQLAGVHRTYRRVGGKPSPRRRPAGGLLPYRICSRGCREVGRVLQGPTGAPPGQASGQRARPRPELFGNPGSPSNWGLLQHGRGTSGTPDRAPQYLYPEGDDRRMDRHA